MPEFNDDSRPYPQGALCEGAAANSTDGRFVTTIHAMNSGVLKLSVLTPITKVYRGAAGMKMPERLMKPDAFNSRLGIEMGFMSTTTDAKVALVYGKDKNADRALNQVYEAHQDSLSRGCVLGWLSQYPGEREVLFGPLTGLEMLKDCAANAQTRRFVVRPTCNQKSVRIEDLVGQRRTMHLMMLKQQRDELKDIKGMPKTLLHLLDMAHTKAVKTGATTYNDDDYYRTTIDADLELCTVMRLVGPLIDQPRTEQKMNRTRSKSMSLAGVVDEDEDARAVVRPQPSAALCMTPRLGPGCCAVGAWATASAAGGSHMCTHAREHERPAIRSPRGWATWEGWQQVSYL